MQIRLQAFPLDWNCERPKVTQISPGGVGQSIVDGATGAGARLSTANNVPAPTYVSSIRRFHCFVGRVSRMGRRGDAPSAACPTTRREVSWDEMAGRTSKRDGPHDHAATSTSRAGK